MDRRGQDTYPAGIRCRRELRRSIGQQSQGRLTISQLLPPYTANASSRGKAPVLPFRESLWAVLVTYSSAATARRGRCAVATSCRLGARSLRPARRLREKPFRGLATTWPAPPASADTKTFRQESRSRA